MTLSAAPATTKYRLETRDHSGQKRSLWESGRKLAPLFATGALVPVLTDWWQSFSGPFLYYPGRRHLPGPLRAFVDFIKPWPGDMAADGSAGVQ